MRTSLPYACHTVINKDFATALREIIICGTKRLLAHSLSVVIRRWWVHQFFYLFDYFISSYQVSKTISTFYCVFIIIVGILKRSFIDVRSTAY